jgi:hypothetical protein
MVNKLFGLMQESNSKEYKVIDEVSLGRKYSSHEVSRQEKLIAKHFGHVEERIRSAGSREGALKISNATLRAFESECMSEIIPEFLVRYLSTLVQKYWGV